MSGMNAPPEPEQNGLEAAGAPVEEMGRGLAPGKERLCTFCTRARQEPEHRISLARKLARSREASETARPLRFSTAMSFRRRSDQRSPSPMFMYKPPEIAQDMLWSHALAIEATLHV
jgi:hypothetical protein